MSEPDPLGGDPFGGIPFLGDLMRMLQGQGPLNWEAARQFAYQVATEGEAEPSIDPSVRFHVQDLARLAELHVGQATGLTLAADGRPIEVLPVTRTVWVARTLDAYRPLFTRLADALGSAPPLDDDAAPPEAAMLGQLMQLVTPTMLGASLGSLIGRLGRRSFGQYDLPLPRPASPELTIVLASVEQFAADWSLDRDELLVWVLVHELTSQAVLSIPHVHQALEDLLSEHAAGFRPDPRTFEERLGALGTGDLTSDPTGIGELQRLFSDPEVLVGAMRTPEQEALRPRLDALVAVLVGYVDHVVDSTATRLSSSGLRLAEAVRRRRIELSQEDRLLAQLLGLSLTTEQVARGGAFVAGALERAGDAGLTRLWESAATLPTPAEVDAPGLWLARLDYA